MILTSENYFSQEASREYISVSQYKDFIGSLGRPSCEETALAKLNGEWEMVKSSALLVGSYVDSHFEGTLAMFKAQNPEIFTKGGDLKAEYRRANDIINRIERDQMFMNYMSGDKQTILTAEMFGTKWKIKMDSYIKGKAIVDLKIMKSVNEQFYIKDYGLRVNFIDNWGYDIQGAVYQEVVYRVTGKRLPFFIAAASKEPYSNIELIQVEQEKLNERLSEVEQNTPKILMLKSGETEPLRCETCDHCKHTKVLTKPIWSSELLGDL